MTFKPKERSRARHLVLQALYQRQVAGTSAADLETQFLTDNIGKKIDLNYFVELIRDIPPCEETLDAAFVKYLDRDKKDLDAISLSILRLSTYELLKRIEIPYRVIVNEAIELCKTFGPTDSYKYINGVIDKTAKELRTLEG